MVGLKTDVLSLEFGVLSATFVAVLNPTLLVTLPAPPGRKGCKAPPTRS